MTKAYPPSPYSSPIGKHNAESHTLSVLVDNEPGVLARVVGLFSARSFNIESLTVAEVAHETHLSRITIVTSGTPEVIEQVRHQLERLVPVHSVTDLTLAARAIERELAMVKVRGKGDARVEALRLAEAFRAKVIDATTESFIFEITGAPRKIDDFVDLMRPIGLVEVSRTGVAAISRGRRSRLAKLSRVVRRFPQGITRHKVLPDPQQREHPQRRQLAPLDQLRLRVGASQSPTAAKGKRGRQPSQRRAPSIAVSTPTRQPRFGREMVDQHQFAARPRHPPHLVERLARGRARRSSRTARARRRSRRRKSSAPARPFRASAATWARPRRATRRRATSSIGAAQVDAGHARRRRQQRQFEAGADADDEDLAAGAGRLGRRPRRGKPPGWNGRLKIRS